MWWTWYCHLLCNITFSSKDKIWLFFQDIYLPWKGQFRFLVDETTLHVFSRRLAGATFPFIANSFVQGNSKPLRNIVEHFFLPSSSACNFFFHAQWNILQGRCLEEDWRLSSNLRDHDAVFVAERSSIGIRLSCQLFANYPLDFVDEKASNNTLVYKFHGEWIMTGIKSDFLYGSSAQAIICGIEIQVWQRVIALFVVVFPFSQRRLPWTSAERIHGRGKGASIQSGFPILVTTFAEWLSGTEPLPHTPGAVRPFSLCL